jgi:3-phenylpropionate/trans-cinnamate dioxygenase ferredoxin reductase subunit
MGGFGGSIAIATDERLPPYERPPLSKEYLAGERPLERMLLRPPGFWAQKSIELKLGTRIVAVEPEAHVAVTAEGTRISYRHLVWAAGGTARPLPLEGADAPNVHTIRSVADVDALRADLADGAPVVVVGGGYIGLETAAVLAKAGHGVALIEVRDRVLARVAGEPISRFYEAEHRAHGVDVRTSARIDRLIVEHGRVAAVELADGERIPCAALVVGIGILPAIAPLADAGAATGNGVHVDACCRTSLPDIFAIGDCAAHENRFAGGARVRLESVQNASDQAKVVASAILGQPASYDAVPWFWSIQYDLKLQTVGLFTDHDATVLRGDPAGRSFSLIYLKSGRVVALDCINAARDYAQGRALVERGLIADPARLADAAAPLKSLLAETEETRT